MPRVKLESLESYGFSMVLPVRTTDVNSADHLAAYALVGMLDEAYARFIRQLDLEKPGFGADNLGSINADLQVNYQGEGKLHDELLIELGLRDLGGKSFRVHYRVTCGDKAVALAEIGVVCFDYREKRPALLPEIFLNAASKFS